MNLKKEPRAIRVKDASLLGCVKKCQKLEKRGYEPIKPIEKKYFAVKDYKFLSDSSQKGKYQFDGIVETVFYQCIMKKVT
jgi:hypothetical protein